MFRGTDNMTYHIAASWIIVSGDATSPLEQATSLFFRGHCVSHGGKGNGQDFAIPTSRLRSRSSSDVALRRHATPNSILIHRRSQAAMLPPQLTLVRSLSRFCSFFSHRKWSSVALTTRQPGSIPIQTPCGLLCSFCKKFHVPEYTACVLAFQRDLLVVLLCCANRDYRSGWLGYGKCMSVDVLGESGMLIPLCGWLWMCGYEERHRHFCTAVTRMTTC